MKKQVIFYYVHRNIPMVLFLYIIRFILFFQIVLNKNSLMKIKILKPKHRNFNLELDGLRFVEFTQNICLIMDGKVPQRRLP
jgi:hypothetical protein